MPILVWKGVDEKDTTFFIVFMLFSVMCLRLFMGWMGDIWSRQRVASIGVSLGIFGLLLLVRSSGQWWQMAAFVFLLACAESVNSNANAMVGDLFGRRYFATLRGWMGLISSIIPMGAPVFTGRVFDQTGSYSLAIISFAATYAVSTILFWVVPKPRPPVRAVEPQPLEAQATIEEPH